MSIVRAGYAFIPRPSAVPTFLDKLIAEGKAEYQVRTGAEVLKCVVEAVENPPNGTNLPKQ